MQNLAKMESGEEIELCPYCSRMGQLQAAGAQIEQFDASGTHVTAVTSENAEVIDKIHAHLDWSRETYGAGDHEGHDGDGHGHGDHDGHDHG